MLTAYSGKAIMTKAKAMYSRHLTQEQYREMLQLKSVADLAAYLKSNTDYAQVLTGVQPAAVHRGQLESLLRKMRYEQYARLMRYTPAFTDSFYKHLMEEAEIEQILDMLRLMHAGHPEAFVTRYPAFMEHSASFSLEALSKAETFPALLQVLEKTPHAAPLRACAEISPGSIPGFTQCETALLSGHYTRLEALIDHRFRGRVRTQLHQLMETKVELINILRIYRVKKYFPEAFGTGAKALAGLRSLLLPSWKRFGSGDMDRVLETEGADAFLKELRNSKYAKYFGEEEDGFLFIEYRADCIEYKLAKRCLHFASDAPTAFSAYMILSQLELENIVTIIEGVRYQVPPEETAALLVK